MCAKNGSRGPSVSSGAMASPCDRDYIVMLFAQGTSRV